MNPHHVVFGTGATGLATCEALRRRGESVRMVNRSGAAPVPDGVEVVGARLVTLENVYLYGRAAGRPLTEDRAEAPHTRKGRLRAGMARELLAAHAAGRVEIAIGRASDYFGPRGGAQSNLGDRVFPAALSGGTATVLGDPDQPHSYTYVPDIGEGLAVLGEHPDAPGRAWHLPNDPHTRSTRQLVELVFAQAGRPRARLREFSPLLIRVAALGSAVMREILEMGYLFAEPFVVDSSRIAAELGVKATPAEQALAETMSTYLSSTPR